MAVNLFRAGNLMLDTPASLLVLRWHGTITAANYQTLRKQDGTALLGVNYQITAGKTFYATQLIYGNAGANSSIVLGYADAAVDNGVAPLNTRYCTSILYSATAGTLVTIPINFSVPAAKYPWVFANAAASPDINLYGVEI